MKQWVIHYADGTTFSDLDGLPEKSPIKSVVCISSRNNAWTAYRLAWYYWHAGRQEWWGGDSTGIVYQIRKDVNNIRALRKGFILSNSIPDVLWQAFLERTVQ